MEDVATLVAVAETQAEVVVTPGVGAALRKRVTPVAAAVIPVEAAETQVVAAVIPAVAGGKKTKKKRRATRKSSR